MADEIFDLIIIGAGPAGISAAYQAKKAGLSNLVIEKGLIGNTIYNYPVGLTVFSTTNELEFNDGDLKPAREKPTREELLSYYVRFVLDNGLNVQTEETVLSVNSVRSVVNSEEYLTTEHTEHTEDTEQEGEEGNFAVLTSKGEYLAKNILFAIGSMDYPRKLNVPGEDLPHVFDNFKETYPWVKKKALIVGGGNSAGEAALFLAQEGADTTLAIFRSDWENDDPKQGCIKYWVKQPLEQELNEHCLNLFFLGKVLEIRPGEIDMENENGDRVTLANDVVFVLIGSDADLSMMKSLGVATREGKYGEVPVYDPETFETNVPGVFVAGHFTDHRHIKGAIDAGKALIPQLATRLSSNSDKTREPQKNV
ncbi:MAG TPA: NAD(P)-binding domain-containing protein [Pyrinomonadaceae bacterium]|nr:NAD(P)-binding domain-containing protein [Acidobacteriota bacterium]HQZ96116.1 NAD(P)-binding domain-containing protein [Pyrinomonadaceae bacterium]